jgi:hypothetical protein
MTLRNPNVKSLTARAFALTPTFDDSRLGDPIFAIHPAGARKNQAGTTQRQSQDRMICVP